MVLRAGLPVTKQVGECVDVLNIFQASNGGDYLSCAISAEDRLSQRGGLAGKFLVCERALGCTPGDRNVAPYGRPVA